MPENRVEPGIWTHECRKCRSELIQPTDWHRHDELWNVRIECPECGAVYEALLDQNQVTDLSYEMEAGFHALLEQLDEIDRALFEDECGLFFDALKANSIFPMDF